MKQIENRGKKRIVKLTDRTSRGRVINAKLILEGNRKNRVFIDTEANRDHKSTRIHFGSIDELRTFRRMINELEREFLDYNEGLASE